MASYRYLIMGTIGATFIVIGIGLLYLMTGTLNLADMARRITNVQGTRPVLAALAFLTVGICLKAALFPLHQWLPDAYTSAPSAVSAFLAGTATKVAVYVLLRFYFSVFGPWAVFDRLPMQEVLLALALAGMFGASTVAFFQSDLKRLFAYSSVGQIGYIVLGLSFNSQAGLTATIVHLFNHAPGQERHLHAHRGRGHGDGRYQPGAHPGPGQAHAVDQLRHGDLRLVAHRRARHSRVREQVVPHPRRR